VKTASEKLLKEQAKNMVMTEEELDYLASLKVRARAEGHAEGRAAGRSEGKNEGHADAISVLQDMGFPPEKIAEAKARLDALNSSK
jgi:predicted transposase YdaD